MRAHAYVSTFRDSLRDDRPGANKQSDAIFRWAFSQGHHLVGSHGDAISDEGGLGRPGLDSAIKAVCAERGMLVVYSVPSLGLPPKDLLGLVARLEGSGGSLVSLEDLPRASGRGVLETLKALENTATQEHRQRIRAGMVRRKAEGRWTGRIPYGFSYSRASGRLSPIAHEQAGLELMRRLRAEGFSLRQLGMVLEEQGYPPKRSQHWAPKVIRGLLKENSTRPVYPSLSSSSR